MNKVKLLLICLMVFLLISWIVSFHYAVSVNKLYDDEKDGYLKEYKNEKLFNYINSARNANIFITIFFFVIIMLFFDHNFGDGLTFKSFFECSTDGDRFALILLCISIFVNFISYVYYEISLRKNKELRKLLDEKVKESMYGFGWVWVSVSFLLIFVLGYGMSTNEQKEVNEGDEGYEGYEEYVNTCKNKKNREKFQKNKEENLKAQQQQMNV